jgi:hypothetical protein
MTWVVLRVDRLREIRVEIEERDGNPQHLTPEEATELFQRVHPLVSDYFLATSTIDVAGRTYDFEDILLDPYRREARHETEPASYPDHPTRFIWMHNFRIQPGIEQERWTVPFRWRDSALSVEARATRSESIPHSRFSHWQIQANLEGTDPGIRLEVDPATSMGQVLSVQGEGNHLSVTMAVEAPNGCSLDTETQTYLELGLRVYTGSEFYSLRVPVDFLCYLGEPLLFSQIPPDEDPHEAQLRFMENLAATSQPETEEVVSEIRQALEENGRDLSLPNVLGELYRILQSRQAAYFSDAPSYAGFNSEVFSGWSRRLDDNLDCFSPLMYLLPPDMTLRYNGDCEDWATFAVAVLTRLHFDAHVALIDMHAWAEVHQGGETIRVDLTTGEGFGACTPLLHPGLSGTDAEWMCHSDDD